MNKQKAEERTYIENLKALIHKTLEDGKADDIVLIDVSNKTDICDYMIVASGTSSRHISSLADKITFDIKHSDLDVRYNCEGLTDGRWVLIDCMDIIVHLFLPDTREDFKIEELWS